MASLVMVNKNIQSLVYCLVCVNIDHRSGGQFCMSMWYAYGVSVNVAAGLVWVSIDHKTCGHQFCMSKDLRVCIIFIN